MSLLSSKPVHLFVSANSLSLHSKGETISVDLTVDPQGSLDVSALISAVPTAMKKLKGKVLMSVSPYWVRHFCVPWQEQVFAEDDWQALAAQTLNSRFGVQSEQYRIVLSHQGYKQPVVAMAMPLTLLTQLEELAENMNWQLEAIESAFVSLVTTSKKTWKSQQRLLMVGAERALFAESKNGIWQRFSQAPIDAAQQSEQLKALIKQAAPFSDEMQFELILHYADAAARLDVDAHILKASWLSETGHEVVA